MAKYRWSYPWFRHQFPGYRWMYAGCAWPVHVWCGVDGPSYVIVYSSCFQKKIVLIRDDGNIDWSGLTPQERDQMNLDALRKARAAAQPSSNGQALSDHEFERQFPNLSALMLSLTFDGTEPRELCRVQVFADGGVWKATLVDPGLEQSLYVTLQRPQDVFKALEKQLDTEAPDWRHWRNKRSLPVAKKK